MEIQRERLGYRIGKIVCLARNYAEHAKELGNQAPEKPVIFMKPATAVIDDGGTVSIPSYSQNCHHEVELAVLIGAEICNASEEDVLNAVAGYGVAIDMTLRDVQGKLKEKGLPWDIAKGFDTACPLSEFVPAANVKDPQNLRLKLSVNGLLRQDGNSSDMITGVAATLAYISSIFTLEAGDIILTGTPAGVGQVVAGDIMEAEIESVGMLSVSVK